MKANQLVNQKTLDTLPNEMILLILSFLDLESFFRIIFLSKKLLTLGTQMINDPVIHALTKALKNDSRSKTLNISQLIANVKPDLKNDQLASLLENRTMTLFLPCTNRETTHPIQYPQGSTLKLFLNPEFAKKDTHIKNDTNCHLHPIDVSTNSLTFNEIDQGVVGFQTKRKVKLSLS